MVDKIEKSDATYKCYLFTLHNFCGLQACVPLLVLLHCGFVFHMYWFTTMNVLNEQYLRTLTLKRTLLKLVCSGPRVSNIAVGNWYHFYFFVYARLKHEKFTGKTYFMQTFANYHQWRVQALSIPTIYSLWGFLSPICSDFARNVDGLCDNFLHN